MTTAPLVMPEVITGLSLLLLFVALEQLIGWPAGRGITTMTIAHMTFSMAYVTVIVQFALATFDTALEEAAMDLGARPLKVFFVITLPIIFPAILSGWLLAFTLSWDDLVISSFTSGPGSSTLPMVVFSKVRLGVSPEINVLATITITVVTLDDRRREPVDVPHGQARQGRVLGQHFKAAPFSRVSLRSETASAPARGTLHTRRCATS